MADKIENVAVKSFYEEMENILTGNLELLQHLAAFDQDPKEKYITALKSSYWRSDKKMRDLLDRMDKKLRGKE